ncbi:MAG: cysteine--tRNA ligase [Candidatus Staskawiczbacteria bacterium RIFCSPLOWO2_01_FULL_33_13]|nr:MAG: cysteine--tRNA ligase [Candidatus Staskawiczbacteria bacterium RIFCSPLOWO2_01_FULL_33_13]
MPIGKLRIYNSLSKKKELLKPKNKKLVNIFVCGPTVYDFSHIGHARTYVILDCFVKYLKFIGFKVFYLQNITNIDDKIIARAREKKVFPKDLAIAFEKNYLKDMKALMVDSVDKYARATDYIKEIISQIERLLQKGYAYQLEDGIYYDISKFKNYGKLSGRNVLGAEDSVSRIDYSKNKKNRGDFCLWKLTERQNEEEPSWLSPFGKGRPGWHIEDTAITEKFFGAQYDIHAGGRDLMFPHHEAEISQMEAISGKKPMAQYWMHTGFLTIDGQKMSKSLNNSVTIDDFLKRHSYQLLRFWLAKNLWHSPIDYSESMMIEVRMAQEKIEEFLRKIQNTKSQTPNKSLSGGMQANSLKSKIQNLLKKSKEDFYNALNDDFNTPKAFAVIFELIKEVNKFLDENVVDKKTSEQIYKFFEEINSIFDIIDFKKLKQSNVPLEVEQLLKLRESYRKSENWQKADEMRLEIEKYGFLVDDTQNGPVLKKS